MIFPKGEIVWVSYHDESGNMKFFLTSKVARDYYFLYEVVGKTSKKLGRSKSPVELETKYEVNKAIGINKKK